METVSRCPSWKVLPLTGNIGCQMRFQIEEDEMKEKLAEKNKAPSAVIVAA